MPIGAKLFELISGIRRRLLCIWGAIPIPEIIMEEPMDFEDRDDETFLRGKTFDVVSESDWIQGAKTFTALTPGAARYFLGAYLLRVVNDFSRSDSPYRCYGLPTIVLVSCLLNSSLIEPVIAMLSAEERSLVAEIIALMIEHSTVFDLRTDEIEGLKQRRALLNG